MGDMSEKSQLTIINFLLREGPVHMAGPGGSQFPVPETLREKFHQIAGAAVKGTEVEIVEVDKLLTTSEGGDPRRDAEHGDQLIDEDLLTCVRFTAEATVGSGLSDAGWQKESTRLRRMHWGERKSRPSKATDFLLCPEGDLNPHVR